MRQRDADLLPAVLEREHLLHAGQRRQRGRAMRPRLDHGACARHGLRAERSLVLGAEAHDLASTDRRRTPLEPHGAQHGEGGRRGIRVIGREAGHIGSERRRPVLEHGHVVPARQLRRVVGRLRSQRIEVRRRQEHAVLPGRGDRHPVTGERILAHLRDRRPRVEHAGVDGALGRKGRVGVIEVDEFAAVGEGRSTHGDARVDDAGFDGMGRHADTLRRFRLRNKPLSYCKANGDE
jgi:hypothetical protein